MPDTATASAATTSSAVSFSVLPVVAVLDVDVGDVRYLDFSKLSGVKERIAGRALAEIVGEVKFSVLPRLGYATAAVVGWIPSDLPASDRPTTTSHILRCGGDFTFANDRLIRGSHLRSVPGVAPRLTSQEVTNVYGSMPTLVYKVDQLKNDGSAAAPIAATIRIECSLRLDGYSFLRTW